MIDLKRFLNFVIFWRSLIMLFVFLFLAFITLYSELSYETERQLMMLWIGGMIVSLLWIQFELKPKLGIKP